MNNKEVSSMKENSSMKVEGEMGFYSLFKSWQRMLGTESLMFITLNLSQLFNENIDYYRWV
jgi:hypothetical protein